MPPKTPLVRPYEYFEHEEAPLLSGTSVWWLYLLGSILLTIALADLLFRNTRDLEVTLGQVFGTLIGPVLLLIVTAIIALFVVAGVMHVFTGGADGEARFEMALLVAGWSYAPDLIEMPITYALTWSQLRGETLDASTAEQLAADLDAALGTTGTLEGTISFVIVAWSVYILAMGTAATHDVRVTKALVPAAIIGVGAFLLRVAGV